MQTHAEIFFDFSAIFAMACIAKMAENQTKSRQKFLHVFACLEVLYQNYSYMVRCGKKLAN